MSSSHSTARQRFHPGQIIKLRGIPTRYAIVVHAPLDPLDLAAKARVLSQT